MKPQSETLETIPGVGPKISQKLKLIDGFFEFALDYDRNACSELGGQTYPLNDGGVLKPSK